MSSSCGFPHPRKHTPVQKAQLGRNLPVRALEFMKAVSWTVAVERLQAGARPRWAQDAASYTGVGASCTATAVLCWLWR